MKRKWLGVGFVLVFLLPALAGAVEKGDFAVDTTADLMVLCTAPKGDLFHKEAVHFCIGFLTGAYHYHMVANSGPDGNPLVSLPDPPPKRSKVMSDFVEWVNRHPQYKDEEPVDTWFRFLVETYPCER
ncbi:MAG: Rap1a/Tai family immunity protein [Deltaproteobacteria bacterium]|nr:Rap1a/Tai family immunity protein [Deltaproteobacteria bacterium]